MNTIKTLLHTVGLDDGEGNTSITRVCAALLLLGFMIVKIANCIHNHTDMTFSSTELEFLITVLGTLVGKTVAEGLAGKLTMPPTTPPASNTNSPAK